MVGLKLWRGCSGRYILSFVATEIKIPTARRDQILEIDKLSGAFTESNAKTVAVAAMQ